MNLPEMKAALNQMRKVVQVMTVIDLNTVHPVIMTRVVTATVQRKSKFQKTTSQKKELKETMTEMSVVIGVPRKLNTQESAREGAYLKWEDHVKNTPIKHHWTWQN